MAGNKCTRPLGEFYCILNSLSSADLELEVPRQTNQLKVHTNLADGVFRVEVGGSALESKSSNLQLEK